MSLPLKSLKALAELTWVMRSMEKLLECAFKSLRFHADNEKKQHHSDLENSSALKLSTAKTKSLAQ